MTPVTFRVQPSAVSHYLWPTHLWTFVRAHPHPFLTGLSMCEVSGVTCVSDDQRYGLQDQIPGAEDCGTVRGQQAGGKQQSLHPEEHVSSLLRSPQLPEQKVCSFV